MAFLLDTNFVSECRKKLKADKGVIAWQDQTPREKQFISVITLLEIKMGVRTAKDREFARILQAWYDKQIIPYFKGRILNIDRSVAEARSALKTTRTIPAYDALLAATAFCHGFVLVTRNTADFKDTGVTVLNPWTTDTQS